MGEGQKYDKCVWRSIPHSTLGDVTRERKSYFGPDPIYKFANWACYGALDCVVLVLVRELRVLNPRTKLLTSSPY